MQQHQFDVPFHPYCNDILLKANWFVSFWFGVSWIKLFSYRSDVHLARAWRGHVWLYSNFETWNRIVCALALCLSPGKKTQLTTCFYFVPCHSLCHCRPIRATSRALMRLGISIQLNVKQAARKCTPSTLTVKVKWIASICLWNRWLFAF